MDELDVICLKLDFILLVIAFVLDVRHQQREKFFRERLDSHGWVYSDETLHWAHKHCVIGLCWAASYGKLKRVKLLRKQLESHRYFISEGLEMHNDRAVLQVILCLASVDGHLETVQYALEQGADKNKADSYGNTPLHDAARQGHLDVALLLISYGADLNARNNTGQLPIDVATKLEIRQAIQRTVHGLKRV